MSMWLAIVLVAIGSYVFRVVPLLLGERMRLSESADSTLRHAAVGAMTALIVLSVEKAAAEPCGADTIPVAVALAVSGTAAFLGRSMPVVVLGGGAAYGLVLGVLRLLIA
jgi:branched-subunit amino acid transport protein